MISSHFSFVSSKTNATSYLSIRETLVIPQVNENNVIMLLKLLNVEIFKV